MATNTRVGLYFFYDTVDPDDSVQSIFLNYAQIGDTYLNQESLQYFVCIQDGVGNQIWQKLASVPQVEALIASIPQANWTQSFSGSSEFINNKPLLATVATSGSYIDLSSKPTIPSAQIQSDWAQASTGSLDYIKNKPSALSFSTPTFSSATTSTQLSSTRSSQVLYSFPTSMTSLLVNQTLTATLQYADDSAFTTNLVSVNADVQGCSGILSLTLSGRLQVQGIIPAGKYRRVVLAQTGGATVPTTLSSGQEVLL